MPTPQRIHRTQRKGWKTPENTIYVGRPTKWGNPFAPMVIPGWATASRQYAVDDYTRWLLTECRTDPRDGRVLSIGGSWPELLGVPYAGRPALEEIRVNLAGRNLACYCPISQPCHADVLLEIANGGVR